MSKSKGNDLGDSDRSLSTFEFTLSRKDLSSIFFIESVEIQLIIPFVEKDFHTSIHLTWQFGETP